jgi:F0F1-type ATP synthase membrane subunit b/b'
MKPIIIFGVTFLGFLVGFLITARYNPDLRRQALGGAVIVFWFGLLFFNFSFPEAIFKLAPQLPPNIWRNMVVGLPLVWAVIISSSKVSPGVTWRQAFLFNPSLIAAVLIISLFFLNDYGILDGPNFIYACSIAMTAMSLTVVKAMFWRKQHPVYPNLYRKIMNQPESVQKTAVKYPPAAGGIEVKSLEEILTGHKDLLHNINLTTETAVFETRYLPAIERYAQLVHLLPASENDHHRDVGGLLHHGLEVGYHTMAFGRDSMYGKELGIDKPPARERWLFACFAAGLCHDLGKVADDVLVSTDGGLVWSPDAARLMEWAAKNQVKKYYVDWQGDRHKVHESFTASMLGKVLTDEDREYISQFDKELSKQVIMALSPSSIGEASPIRPYNIRDMVQKADQQSVKEDKKKSRTPADLGLERPTPLIRHYHDGIQRLLKAGRWRINENGAAAWVMGPDRGLYLVWPRCGMELYESLRDEGVVGSPAAPEVIADILAENDLLVPAAPGDYYWHIKPADMDGPALTVLRINPKFASNFVNPFPSSLGGLVQTDAGESTWTYVEAGGLPAQAAVSSSEKIIPLHPDPETGMEKADLERVMGEDMNVPGNPGPGAGKAPMELPISPEMSGRPVDEKASSWLPNIITVFFHMCLVAAIGGVILVYMKNQVDPEIPYKLAFWMMMGHAMDTGLFVKIFVLGLIAFGIGIYHQGARKKIKQEEQKAAEILSEGQEILASAKQEAMDISADARREGSEIKKTATAEAADIRMAAKEEAAGIREQATQEARQEAEGIIKQAEADAAEIDSKAKQKAGDLSSYFQAKAKNMGITPAEWNEVLTIKEKTEEKSTEIIAQAREQAAGIIAQAREQAQEEKAALLAQAQTLARKESQETLDDARAKAADIIGQALMSMKEQDEQMPAGQQAQEDQHDPEDLPEEEPSPDKVMDDQLADQVPALEGKILGILSEEHDMKKRDLERKVNKSRYERHWELAISNLLTSGKIIYDPDSNIYRCQHDLFQ